MKYLLDTNICIYLFKGLYNLDKKISEVGIQNCAISEITFAELVYGAEKSQHKDKNLEVIENFTDQLSILPIFDAIKIYAREKVRLQSQGKTISDFDLLIGSTSIAHKMIMVTRNVAEYGRLMNIQIENWVAK
ncbi:MAG: type II toxin-antitoxin system VapC family toxin [Bacteroidetes bacterium]|nr:type II toxin-antitoxin system VapC family toxin [Bacteroidota bacterium]